MVVGQTSDHELATIRRRNWKAIVAATVVMMFSYFIYAAAFVSEPDGPNTVEPFLVAIGLAIAPFVFIVLAFASQNATAPRDVLRAMGLLLVVGLSVGLLDPLVGAATGFAAGAATALNRPEIDRLLSWRIGAVVFTAVYCLALFLLITPAGVFTAGIVPLLLVGFADEYAAWTARQREVTR